MRTVLGIITTIVCVCFLYGVILTPNKITETKVATQTDELTKITSDIPSDILATINKECFDFEFEEDLSEGDILLATCDYDSEIRKELDTKFFLGLYEVNNITKKPFAVTLDISIPDITKIAIRTKNYFIVSYTVGVESKTIICDNKTKKGVLLDKIFVIKILNENELYVATDYYDERDFTDPDYLGHIFEEGTLNLNTKQYKKVKQV